jgi:hypothetical protein
MEEALRLLDLARAWAAWAPLLGLGALLALTLGRLALAEVASTTVRVGRRKKPRRCDTPVEPQP